MGFTRSQEIVAEYYIASLGRSPDTEGLDYWAGKLDRYEMTENEIRDMFLNRSIPEVADRFPEGQSSLTTIENIYQNVFGRQSDPGGLYYWAGRLAGTIEGQTRLGDNELISTMIDIAKQNDGDREYLVQQLADAETSYESATTVYSADDYAGDYTTNGVVYAESHSVYGEIEESYDSDWFKVYLNDYTTYEIDLNAGIPLLLLSSDLDTRLTLRDSQGYQISYNDDHVENGTSTSDSDSQIIFTPTYSGYYFLDVEGYDTDTGSYTLSVSNYIPTTPIPTTPIPTTPSYQLDGGDIHIELINVSDDISPNNPSYDNLNGFDEYYDIIFSYNDNLVRVDITGDTYYELTNDIKNAIDSYGLSDYLSVTLGDTFTVYNSDAFQAHIGTEIVISENYGAGNFDDPYFNINGVVNGNDMMYARITIDDTFIA